MTARPMLILQGAVFGALLALFLYLTWLVVAVHGDTAGGRYHVPFADFTNIYAAGLLARTGHVALAYLAPSFEAMKAALLGYYPERADWVYPPTALPFGAMLSLLPLQTAFWFSRT